MRRDACTVDSAGNETSLGTVRVRGRCDLDVHVHRVLLDVIVVSSRLSTERSLVAPSDLVAASKSQFGHNRPFANDRYPAGLCREARDDTQ